MTWYTIDVHKAISPNHRKIHLTLCLVNLHWTFQSVSVISSWTLRGRGRGRREGGRKEGGREGVEREWRGRRGGGEGVERGVR